MPRGDLSSGERSPWAAVTMEALEPRLLLSVWGGEPEAPDVADPPVAAAPLLAKEIGHGKVAEFDDADGDRVRIALYGAGTGEVRLTAADGVDAEEIVLVGTNAGSSLVITTLGAGSATTVGDINIQGDIHTVLGTTTSIGGDLMVSGTATRIMLDDIADGHRIEINTSDKLVRASQSVSMFFDRMADTSIDTHGVPIAQLVATEVVDSDGVADTIEAPWIVQILTRGQVGNAFLGRPASEGNFDNDLIVTGARGALAIGSMMIAGALTSHIQAPNGGVTVIRAEDWAEGALDARWLWSLLLTGDWRRGAAGDMGAGIDLSGVNAPGGISLSVARIAGTAAGVWNITGHGGIVLVGASGADWDVTFTGNVTLLRSLGDLGGKWTSNSLRSLQVLYKAAALGNMSMDLTLEGDGLWASYAMVAANILGNVTGTWDIRRGKVHTILAGSTDYGWDANIDGDVVLLRTRGDLKGTWTSNTLRSVLVLGGFGVIGDMDLDMTLKGNNAPGGITMSSAQVLGTVAGRWEIQKGSAGVILIGTATADWHTTIEGDVTLLRSNGNLSGTWTSRSVRTVLVARDYFDGVMTLARGGETALGTMRVGGQVTRTRILTEGDVGLFVAGLLRNVNVFAGVAVTHDVDGDGVLDLPDPATEINLAGGRASIGTVIVTGVGGQRHSLINSCLAAAEFGTVHVLEPQKLNDGKPFGFAADSIDVVTIRSDYAWHTSRRLSLPGESMQDDHWYVSLV